ncbi:hypothetical protein EUTSA_v10022295mg [Eutrema salsugineum]|uniref:Uncharacterized protein n=1 Tax=Eutrema salsugineum TaxID=72664 RepID=V4NRT8_EUTSA|nr:protein SINE3 [Eutrema salsugineum]ESQ49381.1 hypothetical protein EUTSA_v10022295mg [Eutrema salsugineum]
MKEIQIPRKNFARSSDAGTKRFKDSELKYRKFAEKRQSATFSDLSSESTKDPMDFTPISQISGAISDSEAESFVQGSSLDLLSTPEISLPADESPVSTVTYKDFHIDASSTDRIHSIVDLPASVQSLRAEINELKKLIYSVEDSEESHWIDGVVTGKFRVVLLAFILWAILAAIVVSVCSGEEVAYNGPLPT